MRVRSSHDPEITGGDGETHEGHGDRRQVQTQARRHLAFSVLLRSLQVWVRQPGRIRSAHQAWFIKQPELDVDGSEDSLASCHHLSCERRLWPHLESLAQA